MHKRKYMHKERECESERDTECKDTTCTMCYVYSVFLFSHFHCSLCIAQLSSPFVPCVHTHRDERVREIKLIRTFNTQRERAQSTLCYIWFVYFVVTLLEWIHSQVLCKTKQQRHRLLFKLIYNSWLFDVLSPAMLLFFLLLLPPIFLLCWKR